MKGPVLLDTGPLVALLNRRDRHHAWAAEALAALEPPLLTCEAVLSEACFLVRRSPGGSPAVLELVARGLVEVPFRLADESGPVLALLRRFADVPMSLADAALVRLASLTGGTVLTLDRDFVVYRLHGRQRVPTWMPEVG